MNLSKLKVESQKLKAVQLKKLVCLISSVLLVACGGSAQNETENPPPTPADFLSDDNVAGFLRADRPREFSFPSDHGPHAGYRNEWWYVTGNVTTEEGRRFGYQVTFFSNAIRPDQDNDCEANRSAWCTNRIWMGHAAVSDMANSRHLDAEIFTRQEPGLAGARLDSFRVWLQDWQLFSVTNDFPWELEVITDEFALNLLLSPLKGPVLQGENGLSRKSPKPGNASYYYSMTRIDTTGQIHVDGQRFEVKGSSWLDREWSTSALEADQSGWDWFSLQLDEGTELMYYQLRDDRGGVHPNSQGNWTDQSGTQTLISPDQIKLEEKVHWLAPHGTSYTTEWRLRYRDNDWIIRAVFDDQLMDVTFRYWEGAVDVLDAQTGESLGRGYLEMVHDAL